MKSSWGQTSESLELVQCKEFMGPPGSGAALAQPFEVTMHGQVRQGEVTLSLMKSGFLDNRGIILSLTSIVPS